MIGSRTIEYIIAAQDQATRTLNKIDAALASNEKSFQRVRNAGMTLSAVGAAAAASVLLLANTAGRVEQLNVAFTTMLGSAQAAQQTIEELQAFASKTPFTLPGVERGAQQLLAVGFKAEELIPTLKMVGDVAAGLSLGEDGLQRLILNLGQVKTQGHLTGRELRDFAVNGVPLIEGLANSLGVTKQRIIELTEKGQISEQMVTQAFAKMTGEGGRFGNMMDKQSKTFIGAVSNMKDSITILGRTMGEPLIGPLTRGAQKVAQLANAIGEFTKRNPLFADMAAKALLAVAAIASLTGAVLLAATAVTKLTGVLVVLNGGMQVLVGVITELRIAAMFGAQGLGLAISAMSSLIIVAGAAVAALAAVLAILNKIAGAQASASAAISAEYDKQSTKANELAAAQENLSGKSLEAAKLQERAARDNAEVQNLLSKKRAMQEQEGTFQFLSHKKKEIAALDQQISKAEEAAGRSSRAALDFSKNNGNASEKVQAALEAIQNKTVDLGNSFGSMADGGEESSKKIITAIGDMEDSYDKNVSEINQGLSDLERAHTEKMKSINEKIDTVKANIGDLRDEYTSAMADINGEIAGAVVDQETLVSELKQKMEQFRFDPNGMFSEDMVTVIANRLDKVGIFMDKLSERDIRNFGLKDAQVDQIETLLQLQNAEAALARIQADGAASSDALTEARRRAALTDNERVIEDAVAKREQEEADFQKKMDNYLREQTELERQRTVAQQTYEAQRNQMQLTLNKMQVLHDGFIGMLTDMGSVTEEKVNLMKNKLEELRSTIDQINALLKSQGESGVTPSQAIVNAAVRGLDRAERAMGGPAEGLTWVGERGPELLNLPSGSHVTESGASRRAMSSDGSSAATIVVQGPLMSNVTVTGQADEDRLVQKTLDALARDVELQRRFRTRPTR